MAMPAGAIEGQLRSEDGSPVGNLRIQARLAPATSNPTGTTLSVISFTETDSAGRYDGLPPGSYYIEAGPLGAPRAYFPGAADFVAAKPVAVATSAISGLDFTMPPVPPTFSISGRVTLPPNVNRFPNLVRLENSANLPQFGSITPDGSFRIDHVRAGSYQLWTVPAIAGLPSVRFDVVVTDHDVTTLELVFDRK
jgi:hypothetical protein